MKKQFSNIKKTTVKTFFSKKELNVEFNFGSFEGRSIIVDMYLKRKSDGNLCFTASGYYGKGSRCQMAGQCIDELMNLVTERDGKLCETSMLILANWKRYHLNDLRAGCEHQEHAKRTFKKSYEIGDVCTVCGNKYGHSWHTEILPEELLNWFYSFCSIDDLKVIQ